MSNATIISDCKVMRAATRRRSCSVKDLNRQLQSAVRRDTREELDGRRREGGTERPVASGPACHRAEAAGPINTQHGCRLLCLSLLMATTRSCFYCNTTPVLCFLPRLIDHFHTIALQRFLLRPIGPPLTTFFEWRMLFSDSK